MIPRRGWPLLWTAVLTVVATAILALSPAAAPEQEGISQGFGAETPGGASRALYRVTNLKDAGPGSLRDALSRGNRTVVFTVAGDIVLKSDIIVRGAFVTIDGFSAPPPRITLRNYGLRLRGDRGAHDIIVRGIRVRNAALDGIQVAGGAYNLVIDHVSIYNSGDGNIDVTQRGTRDVTVAWSILAEPAGEEKNMLLAFGHSRVTLHHNLFVAAEQRNPQSTYDDSPARTQAADTTLDMRNNLIWDWRGGYGTRLRYGTRANVVNNLYASNGGDVEDALIICTGKPVDADCYSDRTNMARAYTKGNFSADGINLDVRGTEREPFLAPPVDMTDAQTAACQVLARAGVRPLDAVDQRYLATIFIPSCAAVAAGGGERSFEDTFNRGDADTLGHGWLEVQGGFTIHRRELRTAEFVTGSHVAVLPDLTGRDQSAAADFASVDNGERPRFGVVLRFQDSKNYYLFSRLAGATSVLRISKVVNGVEVVLASTSIQNPRTQMFFRLSGRIVGTTLVLGLDGVEKLSASDVTSSAGSPGILIGSPSGKSHLADNFRATVR